jgi:NitT/TauT family transport system ATP-binding protein
MLVANSIDYKYKTHDNKDLSFSNLSMQINKKGIFSLIGNSGIGKSTLARILSGIDKPHKGEVLYNNQPVRQPSSRISLVLQDYQNAVFPWLTVEENIALGFFKNQNNVHWIKENKEKIRTITKFLGIEDKTKQYPGKLSGGQRQKVQIGRSLAADSDILILDEPTSSVDMFFKIDLFELLINLKENQEKGILLITHDIEEAIFLSEKVYILKSTDNHKVDLHVENGYAYRNKSFKEAQKDPFYIERYTCIYNFLIPRKN